MPSSLTAPKRAIGASGLKVTAIGLGCMSLSGAYGATDDAAATRVLHHAIDRGVDHLDSSDMYGWGHNESLIGATLRGRRDAVMLASKFGQVRTESGQNAVDGRPAHVRAACDASLRRLGVDMIDLYYQHRIDPAVPIEETVGAMAELVGQGKVRALGLCEARPETIRRAHKVHAIAAVQTEFSLLYRVEAEETLRTTRELGIAFVAYSPLGRSLLTGAVGDAADIPDGDGRKRHPRFAAANLARNLDLTAAVRVLAKQKGCTPGQVALAWLLAQGPDILPIPGTKRPDRVDENLGALQVSLSPDEIAALAAAIPAGAAAGTRYPEAGMKAVYI